MAGLIDLKVWQIIFNIANTVILFLALRHFLFQPVKRFMDERTNSIQEAIETAEQKNIEAEKMNQEYKMKLEQAHEEGREIIRNSTKNAEKKSEEILTAAKEDAQNIKAKAYKDIEQEKEHTVQMLKGEVASIAVLAAEKIINKTIDEDVNRNLIDEVINEIGDERWSS
ncbi:MAG: F0F1 ATP synthase subunit B [Proteocatella sp.]